MIRPTPPRFVTRTLIATLGTMAFVLSAVFVVVTLSVRGQVRQSVVEKLDTGQRLLDKLEQRRTDTLRTEAEALAESPVLKAALESYQAGPATPSSAARQPIATLARALETIALRLGPDVLVARDVDGAVVSTAGRRAAEWSAEYSVGEHRLGEGTLLPLPSGVYRVLTIPVLVGESELGSIELAQALDDRYASELSALSGAHTLVVADEAIRATTLPAETVAALTPGLLRTFSAGGLTTIGGEEYAVRPLLEEGTAAVYVLGSVDASAQPLVAASIQRMGVIALGAFALAAFASLWLARTVARPIDTLSASLAVMTRTHKFDRPLAASGASLEVNTLTETFNSMMASITSAQGETLSAYLEAIRALALALDARDPYTAGHSERVSALSVQIGRQMQLDNRTLEVLRLGALLHDIGKIGISDHLLRKPAPLTPDEYHVIKTHPAVGSRILRHVRFLEPHLPIVELHHERPDGGGYPSGLKGSAIPLLARIVHVADAYDAMTSARAYRSALSQATAMRELQRCAGTDFDLEAVQALAIVISTNTAAASVAAIDVAFPAEVAPPKTAAQPAPVTVDALDEFGCESPGA